MCGNRHPGGPEHIASHGSPGLGRKLQRGSAGWRRPAWIPRPGRRSAGQASQDHPVCPVPQDRRQGPPQPLPSPVPRGVLAGARSHSPAATAEGPGALEFPPASSRAQAPPAGLTDRTGRGLGSSGTSPHGPRGDASDPVTCGARPSPVSLRLQEGATPAALGHQPDLISGFPKCLSHVVHGARPIPTSEETREREISAAFLQISPAFWPRPCFWKAPGCN